MAAKNPKPALTRVDLSALLLCSLTGVGITLYSTAVYGAGISPDSVGYLAMARSLAAGGGLVDHTAVVVNYQPGLYPLLLAVIALASGIDPIHYLNLVNAVLFGGIIFLAGVLLVRALRPYRAAAYLATSWVTLASPLYQVSIHAWSEPLFILLTLLFILFMFNYLDYPRLWLMLAGAAAAGLACMARYAGGVEIIAGGLLVLLAGGLPFRKKIANALLFGLVSALPLALWLARNQAQTGSLVGAEIRRANGLSLYDNLLATAYTGLSWLIPNRLVEGRPALVFGLTVAGMLALAGLATLVWRRAGSAYAGNALKPALAPLTFSALYLLFLIYSASAANTSLVDDRFLAPVYAPVLLTALVVLKSAVELITPFRARSAATIALLAVLAAGLLYPAIETWNYANLYHRQGLDFSGKAWVESPIVDSLRRNPPGADTAVFTNGPDLHYLYFYSPGARLPLTRSYFSPAALENAHLDPGSKVELVWFDGLHHVKEPRLEAMGKVARVDRVEVFKEGKIYFLVVNRQ